MMPEIEIPRALPGYVVNVAPDASEMEQAICLDYWDFDSRSRFVLSVQEIAAKYGVSKSNILTSAQSSVLILRRQCFCGHREQLNFDRRWKFTENRPAYEVCCSCFRARRNAGLHPTARLGRPARSNPRQQEAVKFQNYNVLALTADDQEFLRTMGIATR